MAVVGSRSVRIQYGDHIALIGTASLDPSETQHGTTVGTTIQITNVQVPRWLVVNHAAMFGEAIRSLAQRYQGLTIRVTD